MVKRFDAERPVESFKALLADLLKGYTFNVVGLHLQDGSIYPLKGTRYLISCNAVRICALSYCHQAS